MSEHQHLHFLACDRLLTDGELAFMRKQSGHADISRRAFVVEYDWGDFNGDAQAMLRRGYDVHLHYANFGIRRILIRLPAPPADPKTFDAYADLESIAWIPDQKKNRRGPGLFEIDLPDADAGTWDWLDDPEGIAAALPAVREGLLRGDLRPLYLGWLAAQGWHEAPPLPPVPAGMDPLPPELDALAEFYEIPPELIEAAAAQGPGAPPPGPDTVRARATAFADQLTPHQQRAIVTDLLTDDPTAVAARLRQRLRESTPTNAWPCTPDPRTRAELEQAARAVAARQTAIRQAAAEVKAREAERLAEKERLRRAGVTRKNPDAALRRIEKSIGTRSVKAYQRNINDLIAFRKALGPAAAPLITALAQRLNARDRRPVGLLKQMRDRGWVA